VGFQGLEVSSPKQAISERLVTCTLPKLKKLAEQTAVNSQTFPLKTSDYKSESSGANPHAADAKFAIVLDPRSTHGRLVAHPIIRPFPKRDWTIASATFFGFSGAFGFSPGTI
jgi:hypothetical protein